jgi:hypothetical protein
VLSGAPLRGPRRRGNPQSARNGGLAIHELQLQRAHWLGQSQLPSIRISPSSHQDGLPADNKHYVWLVSACLTAGFALVSLSEETSWFKASSKSPTNVNRLAVAASNLPSQARFHTSLDPAWHCSHSRGVTELLDGRPDSRSDRQRICTGSLHVCSMRIARIGERYRAITFCTLFEAITKCRFFNRISTALD